MLQSPLRRFYTTNSGRFSFTTTATSPLRYASSYLSVIPSTTERLCSYMIWSCISNPSLPLGYSLHPDRSIGLIYTQQCRYNSNTDSFIVNSIQARGIRWQKHDSCSHILFTFKQWVDLFKTRNPIQQPPCLSSPPCLIASSTVQAQWPIAFLYWKFDINNPVEHSTREATSNSAGQQTRRPLCNRKVHYRIRLLALPEADDCC